jgi:hypothetical protein
MRLDTGEIFYIGKGSGRRAWSKADRNKYWKNIAKDGYIVEILFKELLESDAFKKEKELIPFYKNIGMCAANITNGGEGTSGYKYVGLLLEKQREQVRYHMKRPDVRLKMSILKKEYLSKPENIEKIRQAKLKSIKEDPGQVLRQKQTLLDYYKKPENRMKSSLEKGGKEFQVFNKDGLCVWQGFNQDICAETLKIHQPNLNKCLRGHRKSTGGYTFKYTEKAI